MNPDPKINRLMTGASVVLIVLAIAFWFDVWGHVAPPPPLGLYDPAFTNTTTVRLSARELIDLEEDVSGMDCAACHEPGKPVELHYDDLGNIVLPKDHLDLVYSRMNCAACHLESEEREVEWDDDDNIIVPEAHQLAVLSHGNNQRNNDCFNCHNKDNLAQLNLRNGRLIDFTETSLLCSECHGPTYRDWELGLHGRTDGSWDEALGEVNRKDCTSCHDPHHPAFPKMLPTPAPQYYQQEASADHKNEDTAHE
jgi:predicted CXXCH cytochrome family protein